MNKEQTPKYADVTPEMMQRAKATGDYIASHATAASAVWRNAVRPTKTNGRGNPGWGAPKPPDFRAEAFEAAQRAQIDDPEGQISVDDMKRVDEMLGEAHAEKDAVDMLIDARDILKTGGRIPESDDKSDTTKSTRFKGYSKDVDSEQGSGFGTIIAPNRTRVDYHAIGDHSARIRQNDEGYGPDGWYTRHEFVGEEGKVANKAIRSIAASRIRRTNKQRREANVQKAQEILDASKDGSDQAA